MAACSLAVTSVFPVLSTPYALTTSRIPGCSAGGAGGVGDGGGDGEGDGFGGGGGGGDGGAEGAPPDCTPGLLYFGWEQFSFG